MKLKVLSIALLAAGLAFVFSPSEAHAALVPSGPAASASVDTGGFLLYQNGKSLSATKGAVHGQNWNLCGFILATDIQGQQHQEWILAKKADPTGANRWVPYVMPGEGGANASDIATRFVSFETDSSDDEGVLWTDMLTSAGMDGSDVNQQAFFALAGDPTVGTLP